MELKIVDENKLAVHATLGEVADAVAKRIEYKKEKPVSTKTLSEHLCVAETTIAYYHSLGMPKNAYNSWYITECEKWRNEEYPKILRKPGRKPVK